MPTGVSVHTDEHDTPDSQQVALTPPAGDFHRSQQIRGPGIVDHRRVRSAENVARGPQPKALTWDNVLDDLWAATPCVAQI